MPTLIEPVEIYAGDTAQWPTFTMKNSDLQPINLVAEGWTDWEAQWRPTIDSDSEMTLQVDTSRAQFGEIAITASATQTRTMGASGVWDLQAKRGAEVKTWVRGKTKYTKDVTRND